MKDEWLAEQFEKNRAHLRAVAYRMLGSGNEAEDAVQEAWLRLDRSDAGHIENLAGWLTTVTGRVCLDMLRSRKSRREEPLDAQISDPIVNQEAAGDPERDAVLADSVGIALLTLLEALTPPERLALVLHDMFAVSFEQIASILGCSSVAARQFASRARRRVRGTEAPAVEMARHRELVGAFLEASRNGDFERLVAMLSPDVVLRADDLAVRSAAANRRRGAPALAAEVRGASQVAEVFKGRARAALPALIGGEAGAAWAMGGQVRSAFVFAIEGGKILGIDLVMDPVHLAELDVRIDSL